jgi:hypothetical protein
MNLVIIPLAITIIIAILMILCCFEKEPTFTPMFFAIVGTPVVITTWIMYLMMINGIVGIKLPLCITGISLLIPIITSRFNMSWDNAYSLMWMEMSIGFLAIISSWTMWILMKIFM